MSKAKLIGPAACILCGSPTARASLMSTARVCLTCNACRLQVFSRGDESDALLRTRIKGALPADPPETKPDPAPIPAPAPADPPRAGWGLLR